MYWYPLKEASRLQQARKLGTLCGLEWNEAERIRKVTKEAKLMLSPKPISDTDRGVARGGGGGPGVPVTPTLSYQKTFWLISSETRIE